MKTDAKQFALILVNAIEGKSADELKNIVKQFVGFLSEKKLLGRWREIEQAIHQVWKDKYGASSIKILSAHTLTDEAKKTINGIAPGADLEERVDDKLIGGAVIRIDDVRVDGSIAGRLQRLKTELIK